LYGIGYSYPNHAFEKKNEKCLSTGYDKYEKSINMMEERGNEASLPFHRFQKNDIGSDVVV